MLLPGIYDWFAQSAQLASTWYEIDAARAGWESIRTMPNVAQIVIGFLYSQIRYIRCTIKSNYLCDKFEEYENFKIKQASFVESLRYSIVLWL